MSAVRFSHFKKMGNVGWDGKNQEGAFFPVIYR